MSLLFLYYLIKTRHHHVIYLGQDIVFNDLKDALRIHKPHYVFTFLNESPQKMPVQTYIHHFAEIFDCSKVLISGFQVATIDLQPPPNVLLLKSLHDTLRLLEMI